MSLMGWGTNRKKKSLEATPNKKIRTEGKIFFSDDSLNVSFFNCHHALRDDIKSFGKISIFS